MDLSYDKLYDKALNNNMSYQLLLLSKTQAQSQRLLAKEDLRPDLRLGAEWGGAVYLKLHYPLGERAMKKHQVYKVDVALKKIEIPATISLKRADDPLIVRRILIGLIKSA